MKSWVLCVSHELCVVLQHTKKISELEEKLHSVAPEEASLLLNEELRLDDSFNSTGLSLYSRGKMHNTLKVIKLRCEVCTQYHHAVNFSAPRQTIMSHSLFYSF